MKVFVAISCILAAGGILASLLRERLEEGREGRDAYFRKTLYKTHLTNK